MALTVIAFFFVLGGASAEVPHWVEQKSPRFNAPSLDKIMAPMHSLQSKLAKQTPSTRRLLAIVSDECAAACPGVGDVLKIMIETSTASTTAPPSGTSPEMAAMMALCDYADTVTCVSTAEACRDPVPEGSAPAEEEDTSMLKCACACPSSVPSLSDPEKMCPEKDAIVGCLTSESSCKTIVKSIGGSEGADIVCRQVELECSKKAMNLGKLGEEKMIAFGTTCSEAAKEGKLADLKDRCCPILKDVMSVYPKECIDLGWAATKIHAENGNKQQKEEMEANLEWGNVCTDSGLATSADEIASSGGSNSNEATDSSMRVGVSLLTMMSAVVALIA